MKKKLTAEGRHRANLVDPLDEFTSFIFILHAIFISKISSCGTQNKI